MKLKEEAVNKCTKKIKIDLDSEEVKQGYRNYFLSIKDSASIPGFRKGKAPLELVETHYKKESKQEVLRALVSENYVKALQELKVNPFGEPSFSDIHFHDDHLSFQVQIEVRPEFQVKKYKALEVKGTKVEVKKEEITEQINHLRSSLATQKAVEDRPVKEGDVVLTETTCDVDGKLLSDKKEETYELDKKKLMEGLVDGIIGIALNEEKSFDVAFPKDYQNEEIKGKTAKFTILVKEIKEKILPELDQEFFKTLGDYKKLEDLESAVERDIRQQKENIEKSKMDRELLDQICKATKFDLPQSFVEQRKQEMIQHQKQQFMMQGIPETEIDKQMDKIQESCAREAERQVQVAFILDQISELEKIEVTDVDLSERFYSLSRQYGRQVDEIRDYYEKQNMIPSLKAEIRNDKAVELIRNNAKIK